MDHSSVLVSVENDAVGSWRMSTSLEAHAGEAQEHTLDDDHLIRTLIREVDVQTPSLWRRFQRWRIHGPYILVGWRWGLKLGFILTTMILVINTAVTVGVVFSRGGVDSDGKVSLMNDRCERTKKYNTGYHLAINILSTLLLGSSNYVIQCLSAPTRSDIDRAHVDGTWLYVGISSLKNLRHMSMGKFALWSILVISSWPLHLFFNSAVFVTLYAHSYDIYTVTGDFTQPQALDKSNSTYITSLNGIMAITDIHNMAVNNSLSRLGRHDCIGEFGQPFQSRNDLLLLILSPLAAEEYQSTTISKTYLATPPMMNVDNNCNDPLSWLCQDVVRSQDCIFCKNLVSQLQSNATWAPFRNEVDHCLVHRSEQQCTLNFSLHIMIIVIIMNATKSIILCAVGWSFTSDPLITLGDAVGSFLTVPDSSTRPPNPRIDIDQYQLGLLRRSAISTSRWVLCICICLAASFVVGGWFFYALTNTDDRGNVWNLGFGVADPRTLISAWEVPGSGVTGVMANALIANLAQPVLSLVYFIYNNFLTALISTSEWDNFALFQKGLRVSGIPRGQQRVTHFLQLPYRYSITLMGFSTLLHWLLSQSIFVVSIVTDGEISDGVYYEKGHPGGKWITCGYALMPLLIVFFLCFVLIGYAIFIGQGRLYSNIPFSLNNSKNIAKECHLDPFKEGEASEKLQWGPRRNAIDGSVQYAFSSAPVDQDIRGEAAPHLGSRFSRERFRTLYRSYNPVDKEEIELQQFNR